MDPPTPGFVLTFTHVPPELIPGHHRGPGRPTSRLGQILHDNVLLGRRTAADLRQDLAVVHQEIQEVRAYAAQLNRIEILLVELERRLLTLENKAEFEHRLEI